MISKPISLLPAGGDAPAGAVTLTAVPLLILVGVTGVGKSTTLSALSERGVQLSLLPNRRDVTDRYIIEPLAGGAVRDREERFRLTARYRETHPGGMAQALASLAVEAGADRLLFDGLRGPEEVSYAVRHFPRARFIALHAPDVVRVRRLLGRADAFDQLAPPHSRPGQADGGFEAQLRALSGATEVFDDAQLAQLAALPLEGLDPAEVLAKTRIVLSERRNYDPYAAKDLLAQLAPERAIVLDTVALAPDEVARRIQGWL